MDTSRGFVIKAMLVEAIKQGAADIHFSVGSLPLMRINNQLVSMTDKEIVTAELMADLLDFVTDPVARTQLDIDREMIVTREFDKDLRFKVNLFYQKGFLSATMRYLPPRIPSLDNLAVSPVVRDLTKMKKGLIIVSGPFGAGRSTTVAALIDEINRTRREYIITIEDPIEYIFTNAQSVIEQREVGKDTKSFLDAVNYFQEEDGDILFLEEMHNPALIPPVLEIARSGALVFTTVSADSAAKTIARILDGFTSLDQERVRDLLATSLKAVVCQRLLPRVGGGLVLVQELLLANEAVKSAIMNGNINQLVNVIQTSRADGMISFEQAIAELINHHQVAADDALDVVADRKLLESLIR